MYIFASVAVVAPVPGLMAPQGNSPKKTQCVGEKKRLNYPAKCQPNENLHACFVRGCLGVFRCIEIYLDVNTFI